MDKNKKLIIAVALLLILVGLFMVFKKAPQKQEAPLNANTSNQKTTSTTLKGTVFDLLKKGETLKCTYSSNQENTTMMGTSYVSGNMMRTDSNVTLSSNTAMESHMISDGTWVYVWTSGTSKGMKMNIADAQKNISTAPSGSTQDPEAAKDFQKNFDYNCSNWTKDDAQFKLPTDIEFLDLSQVMKPTGSAACSACDYIQDDAQKTQCKKSLGC